MLDTHFVNCTGLDNDPQAQDHRTSAYDIALMSRELMVNHPDIKQFTTIWMDTVRNGTFGLSNTNKLVRFYQGATGLKTGFTSAAGYCLSATAQRDGMELIAVVLGAESSQDRFQACKQLLDYGFANYALIRPRPEATYTVPVKLGKAAQVAITPATDPVLLVDKAQKNQVDIQVALEESIAAPVSKGQRLGTMTIRLGEQILQQIPMIAMESVQKKGFWDIFVDVLRQIAMAKPK
jgi:D-alanyl-D-alanine carboxypeptidase (penicillin-binding protein 5/6)